MDTPSAFNWDFDLHIPRYTGTALSEFWFNFILMNAIFLLVYFLRKYPYPRKISWAMVLIFCLYAFWDTDYFSFANNFYSGLENFRDPLYQYISIFSLKSYIIIRFWIWGIGLLLVYHTAKRYKLHENTMCYIFTVFFMLTFSYARVSLGMALYFYGLSYLIIRDNTDALKRMTIIIITFILAYTAHRSILLLILLSPLALLKLTKKKVILILCFLPLIVIAIKYTLSGIISGALLRESNEFTQSAQGYAASKIEVAFNWKWQLITTLRYWSFYIALVCILWVFFFRKGAKIESAEMQSLLTITLSIEIIAITILSIGGNKLLGLWVIGYRYLYMAGIPLCLLLTYVSQKKLLNNKAINKILIVPLLYAELFIVGKILTLQVF